ncbi:Protein arginine N-methyltransferase 9 [Eumeta japonica]|uniref:Protein arginine N-methyltransferase 9 n=1 Tax=Eumeta variegata TaxID=151549 RepID=A0A4C1ZT39_EUMVA|nr:Protein arginine N-methyltransferase 9 [Eumeta japonica]
MASEEEPRTSEDPSTKNITAFGYTVQAQELAANGCYSKAFDLYIMAFEYCPEVKVRVEPEFRRLLDKYNEYLLTLNKIGDIFYNFERSVECYPGNIFILNDIGKYLYKFGYLREACCHFQKALNFDVGFVSAEKNLNSVKNYMIERWHYRMLNDKVRNGGYRDALREMIVPLKETILDLGTGTGLLAMYANECMPMMITACDGSDVMVELASNIFEDHLIEDIILVSKMSTALTFRDIGGKRSLIVTELFDAGLFGEQVLQTLTHAFEHLMAKNARIIPSRAEFFVAGAKCDSLSFKYRLNPSALEFLAIAGHNVQIVTTDPYDSEDIQFFEDLKYVTEPTSLFKVNFNNLEDMQEKLGSGEPYEASFYAKENSEINIIIGWFDLYLTENIMITTNPLDENHATAWQQAVFYDFVPFPVTADEKSSVKFTSYGGKLAVVPDYKRIDRISPEMLRFLNDEEYVKTVTSTIGAVCIYLCQLAEISLLNIVDLSPFPLVGFLLLKRGAQNLTCCARSQDDEKFILKILKANNLPTDKINMVTEEDLSIEQFKDQKFHVIHGNIIDLNGDINTKHKELLRQLKLSHLSPGGLVLPHKVFLEGKLVSCDWLDRSNLIDDANTGEYNLSKFMNKYQVSQMYHIDIPHMPHKTLSEVATIAQCTEGCISEVINVKPVDDGDVNAILCWYKLQLVENGEFLYTNRSNSFVDSMAFMANPKITIKTTDTGNILRCVDIDETFKLLVDVE